MWRGKNVLVRTLVVFTVSVWTGLKTKQVAKLINNGSHKLNNIHWYPRINVLKVIGYGRTKLLYTYMTTSKGKLLMEDVGAVRSYCRLGFTAKLKSAAVITYICMYKYRISLVRMRPLLHCALKYKTTNASRPT